jgi:peptidoglycan L-alanyl-D-glutamate endopeptidase CwlK
MSYQLLTQDVLFYQRFLTANGFDTKGLDGAWGKNTNAADAAFTAKSKEIASQYGTFDTRSEGNIITLAPKVQVLARKFLKIMADAGKDVRIISGTRTYAEQDALYNQGRNGNTQPKVTNAKGGQSNHNFGLAWDIGLFENGKYITDDKKYTPLAKLAKPQLAELEWGGDWISFPDIPHYQHVAISGKVSDIRALFEAGKPYLS